MWLKFDVACGSGCGCGSGLIRCIDAWACGDGAVEIKMLYFVASHFACPGVVGFFVGSLVLWRFCKGIVGRCLCICGLVHMCSIASSPLCP